MVAYIWVLVVYTIWQGLTLVHFSAQPEPFLTFNTSPKRLKNPSTPALNSP